MLNMLHKDRRSSRSSKARKLKLTRHLRQRQYSGIWAKRYSIPFTKVHSSPNYPRRWKGHKIYVPDLREGRKNLSRSTKKKQTILLYGLSQRKKNSKSQKENQSHCQRQIWKATQKQRKRLRKLFSHFHQSGLPYSHLEKILKTTVATPRKCGTVVPRRSACTAKIQTFPFEVS